MSSIITMAKEDYWFITEYQFHLIVYTSWFGSLKTVFNRFIGLLGRDFVNGPGDLGSIQGRVIPKSLIMVFDTTLLNTQKYMVRIKDKVEQSRERSYALSYTSV